MDLLPSGDLSHAQECFNVPAFPANRHLGKPLEPATLWHLRIAV